MIQGLMIYNRPVNPIDSNLLPHFLCCSIRSLVSKSYDLRSVTIAIILIGVNIPGPSHFSEAEIQVVRGVRLTAWHQERRLGRTQELRTGL